MEVNFPLEGCTFSDVDLIGFAEGTQKVELKLAGIVIFEDDFDLNINPPDTAKWNSTAGVVGQNQRAEITGAGSWDIRGMVTDDSFTLVDGDVFRFQFRADTLTKAAIGCQASSSLTLTAQGFFIKPHSDGTLFIYINNSGSIDTGHDYIAGKTYNCEIIYATSSPYWRLYIWSPNDGNFSSDSENPTLIYSATSNSTGNMYFQAQANDNTLVLLLDNVEIIKNQYSTAGETATLLQVDLGASHEINWADFRIPANTLKEYGTLKARRKLDNGVRSAYLDLVHPEDIVGYWRMEEDSWDGTVGEIFDSSGRHNHGTAKNGLTTIAGGKIGRAGDFDGTNDYINIPDHASLDITGAMTIAAWVNADAVSSTMDIIGKQLSSATGVNYGINYNAGGTVRWVISSGAAFVYRDSTFTPDTNWRLIVCVYVPSTNLDIYVDGSLSNGTLTGTIPASLQTNNIDLRIGRRDSNTNPFNGIIDEFAIWNRALSESEIADLYNNGAGRILPEFELAFASSGTFNAQQIDLDLQLHSDGTQQCAAGRPWIKGFTPIVCDYPVVTDVRTGVSYEDGSSIGTAAIPAASDTRLGVPTDATVGNYVPADEDRHALGDSYGSLGTEFTGTKALTPFELPVEVILEDSEILIFEGCE